MKRWSPPMARMIPSAPPAPTASSSVSSGDANAAQVRQKDILVLVAHLHEDRSRKQDRDILQSMAWPSYRLVARPQQVSCQALPRDVARALSYGYDHITRIRRCLPDRSAN